MKALFVAVGAGILAVVGGVVFLWPTHQVGSEPIHYGRDACAHCRMHISQAGFAGEVRDRNGVLTKYDDLGCMLRAMVAMHREIPEAWVEDHDGGGLIPLLTANLVRGNGIQTPMGYGIVAFKDERAAAAFAQAQGATVVALEDILKNPARLARPPQMHGDQAGTPAEEG